MEFVASSFFSKIEWLLLIFSSSSWFKLASQSNIEYCVMRDPPENIKGLETTKFSELNFPYISAPPALGRLLINLSVTSPPAMASNNTLKPWALMAYLYWSTQSTSLVLMMWVAPSCFRIYTCSFLLTMLSKGIFSLWQYLLSILPKAEAAAVLMIPFPVVPLLLHFLKVSTIPTTLIGLMMPDAADSTGTSSSMTQTSLA